MDNTTFDLEPRHQRDLTTIHNGRNVTSPSVDLAALRPEMSPMSTVCNADVPATRRVWDHDSGLLVSSEKWLQTYGLKRAKLDMGNLLRQIGFRHSYEYDQSLKMPVCSRYGTDLFQKYFQSDGRAYNIMLKDDVMKQIEARLVTAVELFQRRLDWLTTDSRRLFGVITEKCVCIVLDFRPLTPTEFDLYISAVVCVLREQVAQLSQFNIIRAQQDISSFSDGLAAVSGESIEAAVDWVQSLSCDSAVNNMSTCEALLKAVNLASVEAVYLFTESCSIDANKDMLKDKILGSKVPVHLVSHNCNNVQTITFLRHIAESAKTKFHAYAVNVELELYERSSMSSDRSMVAHKKVFGGAPDGAGVRPDVMLIFEELEEAKNNLKHIRAIIKEQADKLITERQSNIRNSTPTSQQQEESQFVDDTYLSSVDWLKRFGLRARRLDFYEVLASVVFPHEDGVVDLKVAPPGDEDVIHDAVTVRKLIGAKYCEKFGHVIWKDGRIMHVNVTKELYRTYKERLNVTLDAIQRRIDWLMRGSREIFGTVIEDDVYLLIDTSLSMQLHMPFVKDKIQLLMQEQLRHKQTFNIVAFDSLVHSWQSSLVKVTEDSLRNAWNWVTGLTCHGTTNTLDALQVAFRDKQTKAVYLLTDGRPNQPPKSIIAHSKFRHNIPVHTISFNCNDRDANLFLFDLAHATGGRFHYYSMTGCEIDASGPTPWQSEDVALLRQEVTKGRKFLTRMHELLDDCLLFGRDTDNKGAPTKRKSGLHRQSVTPPRLNHRQHQSSSVDRVTVPARDLSFNDTHLSRPTSASELRHAPRPPTSTNRPQTAHGYQPYSRQVINGYQPSDRLTDDNYLLSNSYEHTPVSSHRQLLSTGRESCGREPTGREPARRPAQPGSRQRNSIMSLQLTSPPTAGHTRTSLMRTTSLNSGRFISPELLLPETRQLLEKQQQRKERLLKEEERKKKKHRLKNKKLTKPMSSKRWLSKHGLTAKKLTIIDLVAPTFISHSAKYVPIIDRQVMSKVFDEVLPVGYVPLAKPHIYLSNPLAVDYDKYKEKLNEAIKIYKRRLDRIVWNALSDQEQKSFNSSSPVSFTDHRNELLEALDRDGSPLQLRDIKLLEAEICRAEQYKEQANSLQAAAANHGDGLPVYDDGIPVVPRCKKQKDESTTDAHQEQKVCKKPVKQNGLRVVARNKDDGFFYPGVIADTTGDRQVSVEFDSTDIGVRTVSSRYVIPLSGAIARPHLSVNDYVLCRVLHKSLAIECYVPGRVVCLPCRDDNMFFTVRLYTSKTEQFMRSCMIKITAEWYKELVSYIKGRDEVVYPEDESCPVKDKPTQTDEPQETAQVEPLQVHVSVTEQEQDSDNEHKLDTARKSQKYMEQLRQNRRRQKQLKEELLDKIKKYFRLRQRAEQSKKTSNIADDIRTLQDELSGNRTNRSESARSRDGATSGRDARSRDGTTSGRDNSPAKDVLDKLRTSLPVLNEGDEVLARWCDDGWYYRGVIRYCCEDDGYIVEDGIGYREWIWREDILTDADSFDKDCRTAIALHPHYSYSYCPAEIKRVGSTEVKLKFYDGVKAQVPRDEVYTIPSEKYNVDVENILAAEKQLVGQIVVTRDDDSGIFQVGKVLEQVDNKREYNVELFDGRTILQSCPLMFGKFTRQRPLEVGDCVLCANKLNDFMPGKIQDVNKATGVVTVCFHDNSTHFQHPEFCFYLSESVYNQFIQYTQDKENERDGNTGTNQPGKVMKLVQPQQPSRQQPQPKPRPQLSPRPPNNISDSDDDSDDGSDTDDDDTISTGRKQQQQQQQQQQQRPSALPLRPRAQARNITQNNKVNAVGNSTSESDSDDDGDDSDDDSDETDHKRQHQLR